MVHRSRLVSLSLSSLLMALFLAGLAGTSGPTIAGTCLGLEGSPGDVDGDGVPAAGDCDDGNPALSSTPGESQIVTAEKIGADILLGWDPPVTGDPPTYYQVHRTSNPGLGTWNCLGSELTSLAISDRDVPLPNEVFYYIVQPVSECGDGDGGSSTSGQPRGPLVCDCSVICDDGNSCTEDTCQSGGCFNPLIEPTIVRGPKSGATCAGSGANFSVVASGSGNLSYQWFINGNPAGLDAPVLVLSSLTPADDGAQVSVEITDGCATAFSANATLSVFADPASCAGGIDGQEASNGASRVGPLKWMSPEAKNTGSPLLHSGEYFLTEADLIIPGRGFDFVWARTYRSREDRNSLQGTQWTHGYDLRVEQGPAGERVLHDGSQGRVDLYQPSLVAPNCWESPGFFRELCLMPDGRHVLTFADRAEWIFRPGDGLIEATVDRNGNVMFFGYDPFGRLEFIDDTLNRPIQLFYNPDGFIESVTDFTGRAVTYDYYEDGDAGGSAGDLKSVTSPPVLGTPHGNDFPQGKTTTYTYTTGFADERLNHNLLTITDPLGQVFVENVYTPTNIPSDQRFDRLDHTVIGGDTQSYMYVQPPFDPAFPQIVSGTYANDRAGNVRLFEFDAEARTVRTTEFTGRAPDASRPTDGVQNAPVNQLRGDDPASFQTVYLHNNDSLPELVVYPRGNQVVLQYDSFNPNPRLRGNLLQRERQPGPAGGSQPVIIENWNYATDYGTSYPVIRWSGEAIGEGVVIGGSTVIGRGRDDSQSRSDSMSLYGMNADHSSDDYSMSSSSSRVIMIHESSSESAHDKNVMSRGRRNARMMDSSSDYDSDEKDGMGRSSGASRMSMAQDLVGGTSHTKPPPGSTHWYRTKPPPGSNHWYRSKPPPGSTHWYRTKPPPGSTHWYLTGGDGDTTADPGGGGGGGRVVVRAFPTSHTDGRGNTYNYVYNPGNGNLEQVDAPLVVTGTLGGGTQVVRTTWQYNSFGQVTESQNPAGRLDVYTYYTTGPERGYLESVIIDQPGWSLTTSFQYDPVGNVRFVTDPKGNTSEAVYNQLDQVVRVIDKAPFLYESDLYYDANDNVVRVDVEDVDENGAQSPNPYLSTTSEYDILDREVRAQAELGPGGSCVAGEFEYDANSNKTLVGSGEATNGNDFDNVTRYIFDERDLLYQEVRAQGNPDASTTQFDYDPNRNVRAIRKGLEDPVAPHVTSPQYDGYDRLVFVEDPLGNATTFDYDANDNVVERAVEGESPQGSGTPVPLFERDFLYDELDRLVASDALHFDTGTGAPIGDGLSTVEWFYDPDGRVVRVENDNSNALTTTYDSVRRVRTVTDAASNTTTYDYDNNSNVTTVTELDRSGSGLADETFVTTHTYDTLDRKTSVTDNALFVWDYGYDSRDNLRLYTDSLDNETIYVYDGMDRLIRETRPLTADGTGGTPQVDQVVTEYCWDDASRLVCRTDDNLNTTTYAYDSLDRRISTTHADGSDDCLIWDIQDNSVESHDANGTLEVRTYDDLDRLVTNTVTRATGVLGTTFETFQYDGLSRIVTATNDDSVVTHSYDSMSNAVEETLQVDRTLGRPVRSVTSVYDGVGNRTSMTYPTGRVVTTTYDSLDRVHEVVSGATLAARYTYIGPWRVERVDRPLGISTDYEYDARPLPSRVRTLDGGGSALDDHTYTYDGMHNKITETDQSPTGLTLEWDYDSIYRLIESRVAGAPAATTTYTYDGVGNRILVTGDPGDSDPGTYLLNAAIPPADAQCNQYSSTPWDSRLYDENGNLIFATSPVGGPAYQYDYLDRMVLVDDGVGSVIEYKYDAYGRRIERHNNTTLETERFYYDGHENIVEEDQADTALRDRVLGRVIDELLESEEYQDVDLSGALDRHLFFFSEKDVTAAVDEATGLVVERYTYDEFGLPEFSDGAGTPLPRSGISNPFLFTGRRLDDESGLYWFRTRYYDARAGRFNTRDTIGTWGDAGNLGNAYTYVGNNPATFTDPFGEMNKAELIDAIAKDAGLSKADAKRALEEFHHEIKIMAKKGDRVSLIGFGSMSISKRAARKGRNPQTGKEIKIAPKHVVKFKAGKALADTVK